MGVGPEMGHANDDVGRVLEREHASGDVQEGHEMGRMEQPVGTANCL